MIRQSKSYLRQSAAIGTVLLLLGSAVYSAAAIDPGEQKRNYARAAALGLEPSSLAVRSLHLNGDDLVMELALGEKRAQSAAAELQGASAVADSLSLVTVVDYGDDGIVDRVVAWDDLDGDGRPERQILYGLTPAPLGGDFMSCIVVDQRANERGFFALDRWQYRQDTCQGRSDFSGDGFHALGRYDDRQRAWHSYGENPFCFYDPDDDGITEEALLLAGDDGLIREMRWSFDADNDADAGSPYDYDFSLTAKGNARALAEDCDSIPLLGGGRLPVIRWDRARDFVRAARWERALLVWDENDRNIAPEDPAAGERWEGVIAEGVPGFGAVGGPACGFLNKRYELDQDGSGGLRLYISSIDGRMHLFGAEHGWLRIDADEDGKSEAVLRMDDTDADGRFDTWSLDIGEDGFVDATARGTDANADVFEPEFAAVQAAEAQRLAGPAGEGIGRGDSPQRSRYSQRSRYLEELRNHPWDPAARSR